MLALSLLPLWKRTKALAKFEVSSRKYFSERGLRGGSDLPANAEAALAELTSLSAEGSDPSASYIRYIQLLTTLREYACYEGPTGVQPTAYEWRRVGESTPLPGTVDGETIAFVCNAAAARANAAESALQRAVLGYKEAAKNALDLVVGLEVEIWYEEKSLYEKATVKVYGGHLLGLHGSEQLRGLV